MSKEFPSETALIADLRATFPGLMARPIREFKSKACESWGHNHGVWTGGTGESDGCMPDGLPIFNALVYGCEDGYDGHVHDGFSMWLESRGWRVEAYDAETYLVVPLLQASDVIQPAYPDQTHTALVPGECPF